ncbi:MAG: MFS transporter [Clostridia bacterium]|nr:MFS transporter [Clostridia bacterium]
MKSSFKATLCACFTSSVCMAITNNYIPLLFLTFQRDYQLSFTQLSLLVTLNFLTQMTVDLIMAKAADRLGYRACLITAHLCSATGLIGLVVFPRFLPPFIGLLAAVVIYSIGGGISEVLVSPVIEGCPTKNKTAVMNLGHSFYCWGHMAVVLLSSLFFALFGIDRWEILALIWAILPLWNAFMFTQVPIHPPVSAEQSSGIRALAKQPVFWLFILLMFASGAGELTMGQWGSAFAEQALGVNKATGDLLGPCLFAGCMGLTRIFFSRLKEEQLQKWLIASAVLSCGTYLLAAFSPSPIVSLAACAATGFGVGAMWPSCLSLGSKRLPTGGTAFFALMAVAGDLGCCGGPTMVGALADAFGGNMRIGFACACIFPLLVLIGILTLKHRKELK